MKLLSQDKRKDGYKSFFLDKNLKPSSWQGKYISIKAILF